MKKQFLITALIALSISACSAIPRQAYDNRGQPEALLSVSSDAALVDISARNGLARLDDVVSRQQPTSAQLSCSNKMLCDRAVEILRAHHVPFKSGDSRGNSVTLNYKNIVARDCDNSYIDNRINPYNLNYATFGCSVAVNQVQMVSDKRQFVDPLLLGAYDGEKAAQNYDTYQSRDAVPLDNPGIAGGGSSGGSGGGSGGK